MTPMGTTSAHSPDPQKAWSPYQDRLRGLASDSTYVRACTVADQARPDHPGRALLHQSGRKAITTMAVSTAGQHHPAVARHDAARKDDLQLRVADVITTFAGSMAFVYLHALAFAMWMLLVERSPWPTLTLIVSLEAIFLSTFVLIGQNRQAEFQQAKADHDFLEQELELKTNTDLTRAIHLLTVELHRRVVLEQT